MTIKELCNKYNLCKYCTFFNVCPYYDHWNVPLNRLTDADTEVVTKAIIETAKILLGDKNE